MSYTFFRRDNERAFRVDETGSAEVYRDGAWKPFLWPVDLIAMGIGGGEDYERATKAEVEAIIGSDPVLDAAPDEDQIIPAPKKTRKRLLLRDSLAKALRRSGFSPTVEITKTADKNLVFGWASVIVKDGSVISDLQGHSIDVAELEDAAYRHVRRYRKTGEMHQTGPLGEMVESMVFTPEKIEALGLPADFPVGWWVGYRVPPATFAKVKGGQYRMFSIQGGAVLEPIIET